MALIFFKPKNPMKSYTYYYYNNKYYYYRYKKGFLSPENANASLAGIVASV